MFLDSALSEGKIVVDEDQNIVNAEHIIRGPTKVYSVRDKIGFHLPPGETVNCLHNPQVVSPEQVGYNYRLLQEGEPIIPGVTEGFNGLGNTWYKVRNSDNSAYSYTTYRNPISIPWREKPHPVPPGSVFRHKKQHSITMIPTYISKETVSFGQLTDTHFDTLRISYDINRSLSKGAWNENAWEDFK
jgi:hypothetical protein